MNYVLANDSRIIPAADARAAISSLAQIMLALPDEAKGSMDTRHDFCPGIYARTVFMKAGDVVVSRIHKTKHFFVVVQGSCTVVASDGSRKLIEAPYLGATEPGTQRVLHIHEDCIWTTFHVTELTDPEAIGREIIAESFEQFDAGVQP